MLSMVVALSCVLVCYGRRDLFRVIDLDDNGSVDHEEFFKDAGMLPFL